MIKNIEVYQFPERKNEFKEKVGQIWSRGGSQKKPKQISWLKYSLKTNETINLFVKDPERWKKFQNEYQNEFEGKIQLMDEIRVKKKGNEPFYWLFAGEDSDF